MYEKKTIEEKAKAYDEATKIIKANLDALNDITEMGEKVVNIQPIKNCFYRAFPELKNKEDEDEKIRKELLAFIKKRDRSGCDYDYDKWIAWLEKQRKIVDEYEDKLDRCACENFNKGYKAAIEHQKEKQGKQNLPSVNERAWLYLVDDVLTWNNGIGQYLDDPRVQKLAKDLCSEYAQKLYNFPISSNSSNIENNKQEPADKNKTEAKFHEGEWVINQVGYIRQIIDIKDNCYYCNCNGKGYCTLPIEYADEYWRKWTINDAKDGDVLATDKGVFIYAKTLYSKPYACCGVDKSGVFKDYCLKNNLANSADNIHPATKEQRDTLMKAMADAGYTFDFEKKELKKIEDKPLVIDEGKDEIDRNFTEMMLKDYTKQKPIEWSEKDKKMLKETLALIETVEDINKVKDGFLDVKMWLKSLKDKVLLQNTWKPSDELIQALERSADYLHDYGKNDDDLLLLRLLEELKKIKEE